MGNVTKKDTRRRILSSIEGHFSFALAALIAALLALGTISGRPEGWGVLTLVLLFILYLIGRLAYLGYEYVHLSDKGTGGGGTRSIEPGVLILVFLYLLIGMTGGCHSQLVPLVYVAVAVLAAFNRPWIGLVFVAIAIAFEVGIPAARGVLDTETWIIGGHVVFIVIFGSLTRLMHRFGATVEEQKGRVLFERRLSDIERDARRLRRSEQRRPGKIDAEYAGKLDLSSYFEFRDVLEDFLKLLATAQNAYTCAALLYDEGRRRLKVIEACTSSKFLSGDEFPADEGLLQVVVKQKTPLRAILNSKTRGRLGYYRRKEPVAALCAVPVLDGKEIVGVLALDREEERAFSDDDLAQVEIVARQINRSMVNEDLMLQLEKSQNEYYYLAVASKALSQTLDTEDVLRVSLDATREIAPYDFGAIVLNRPGSREYEIMACRPRDLGLKGGVFHGEKTLVDWVVRKNQALIHDDVDKLPRRPTVFSREEKLHHVASLLIVPLNVKAHASGAFVLASSNPYFFTADLQHVFHIIANQIAVSLENAKMYEQVERMAITDVLTGLYNKRHFEDRFDEIISRAERYDHRLALVMMDLDHFKRINDNYGHPMGDQVLRAVGIILNESMRKIDLVARFGGEEFVVLLDSTDHEQALKKTEQLSEEIADLSFEVGSRKIRVSLSAGIAVFPDDSHNKEDLLEKADKALYQSKKSGRNRTTLFRDLPGRKHL